MAYLTKVPGFLPLLLLTLLSVTGCGRVESKTVDAQDSAPPKSLTLLNVSYDPTRELWQAINHAFVAEYQRQSNTTITVEQSHGASASQARTVIDGLDADVVTLAMWADTHAIEKAGLIQPGWEDRFSNNSLPYWSTIVFVVRKDNPKQIKDWPDLVRDGVGVITPSAKTSGNGKLSFLAAWGSVLHAGGSDDDALAFVTKLYDHVKVLDSGARGATTTFAQRKIGDVHLTWENEAFLEIGESKGELEIIYPSVSIRAEPRVAIVDANVDRRGTRAAAKAYLDFLYSEKGQEIIAVHHYRPSNEDVLTRHSDEFPQLRLLSIKDVAGNWANAEKRFFATGAIFDQIFEQRRSIR